MRYDLLLAGGMLVDPAQHFHDIGDVAFVHGSVEAVGRDLPREAADTVVNCAGRAAGFRPLQLAREAADAAGLPIMVHPQEAWCDSIDDILALLRANDILTHCFHGSSHGILDERGRVRDSVRAAIERGVIFDVGHGAGSFSWAVAERALAQGIQPQTISSDLHVYNGNGPVYDLPTTASKFLQLGLTLDQVIAKVTAAPAQAIGRPTASARSGLARGATQ